jgi:hypothetical protein
MQKLYYRGEQKKGSRQSGIALTSIDAEHWTGRWTAYCRASGFSSESSLSHAQIRIITVYIQAIALYLDTIIYKHVVVFLRVSAILNYVICTNKR